MISFVAIVVLRFVPLGLLMVFCVFLAVVLKEELQIDSIHGTVHSYYLVFQDNLSGEEVRAGERWLIGEKLTVGRDEGNQIVIDDPYVSIRHACIQQLGAELWLEDLGSTNGTYLNGRLIKGKSLVQPGEFFSIGKVVFGVVRGDDYASSRFNPPRTREAGK